MEQELCEQGSDQEIAVILSEGFALLHVFRKAYLRHEEDALQPLDRFERGAHEEPRYLRHLHYQREH
jgi:hypothetical protein